MAAYELVQMGFDNICVLKGGFTDWTKSGRCVLHASAYPLFACAVDARVTVSTCVLYTHLMRMRLARAESSRLRSLWRKWKTSDGACDFASDTWLQLGRLSSAVY